MTVITEHEDESVPGLPGRLPAGETIVWQGRPDWWSLARRTFHIRAISIYFGVLAAWKATVNLYDGGTVGEALAPVGILIALGAATVLFFLLFAWLIARSTLYTLTNRRLALKFGVALPMTVTIPYSLIEGAALKAFGDGCGDIPVQVKPEHKVSYVLLWPHARPWRYSRPEPMLRSVPDAHGVAEIFARTFAAASTNRVVQRESMVTSPRPDAGIDHRPTSLAGAAG